MSSRNQLLENIENSLAFLKSKTTLSNRQRLYDNNIKAEDIFAGLLKLCYGWNLHNMNEDSSSEMGVDLIDEDNKIVIQITSKVDAKKIRKTINGWIIVDGNIYC